MGKIVICRAEDLLDMLKAHSYAAVLSIEHPLAKDGEGNVPRLAEHGYYYVPQKILSFWDIEDAGKKGPDMPQVEDGIAFAVTHLLKGDVIIHCHAGISRSPALALGVLALLFPDDDEAKIVDILLAIQPMATPNLIITGMVDKITGREGRLFQAVIENPRIALHRHKSEQAREWIVRHDPALAAHLFPEKLPFLKETHHDLLADEIRAQRIRMEADDKRWGD